MQYHSLDWGFDRNYHYKKIFSQYMLEELHLPICKNFNVTFHNLKKYFHYNNKYIILVSDYNNIRKGYFNICNYNQLLYQIGLDFTCPPNNLSFRLIEQIDKCDNCFTATFFSNGRGSLILEAISNTVDNRFLTSGDERYEHKRIRIDFSNSTLTQCDNFQVLCLLNNYLKDLMWIKGYYELSYGKLNGYKGVYFTYFSNDETYMNIFNKNLVSLNNLTDRCRYLYLLEAGYLY